MSISQNSQLSELIKKVAQQRYDAMALKLVTDEAQVPAKAWRPFEQSGKHIALCQAFALSRRQGKTVYMRKEDHWCWAPLIAFGEVECNRGDEAFQEICKVIGIQDPEEAADFVENMVRLPYQKYRGILCAPLHEAEFEPDIVLINCNNAQLRTLLLAVKSQTGSLLDSQFDPIDSCIWSIIPPLTHGTYRITLPDPGDYARALTDENDIIFTVPCQKIEEFSAGLSLQLSRGAVNSSFSMDMKNDFPRPPFYNTLYHLWGLPQGEDWDTL